MCKDRDCNEVKVDGRTDEQRAKDRASYRGLVGDSVRTEGAMAGAGQLGRPRLAQYTPLLVQTMFELYCFPDKRRELLRYQDRPSAVHEVMNLLERAGIVHAGPNGFTVDEDALRAYVNAVCSVPLPTKVWRMEHSA